VLELQVGFKIFLNITPTITNWTSDNKQFSLVFDENPLADFVELPDDGRAKDELWFSNILCGVLRGALEMVSDSQRFEKVPNLSVMLIPLPNLRSVYFGWLSSGLLTRVVPGTNASGGTLRERHASWE